MKRTEAIAVVALVEKNTTKTQLSTNWPVCAMKNTLLPGGLFLGRRTQNRPKKIASGLEKLQPRKRPNLRNAA
jgi:hypothetical protein